MLQQNLGFCHYFFYHLFHSTSYISQSSICDFFSNRLWTLVRPLLVSTVNPIILYSAFCFFVPLLGWTNLLLCIAVWWWLWRCQWPAHQCLEGTHHVYRHTSIVHTSKACSFYSRAESLLGCLRILKQHKAFRWHLNCHCFAAIAFSVNQSSQFYILHAYAVHLWVYFVPLRVIHCYHKECN